MGTSVIILALAAATVGVTIPRDEAEKQNQTFKQLWHTDFVWKYDDLPDRGGVADFRVPYSGYIYPDNNGGTTSVSGKYDRAFNGGRGLATGHEQWDTTAFKEPVPGLFGGGANSRFGRRFGLSRMRTPDWYGHCNGWTSAAIRHAEPQHNVTRNGVVFTPSDIKGLLAEIYIYNDHDVLVGEGRPINAGAFHAIMGNWLGRGEHPLGMESDPGEEKWNYPVYAYATSAAKHSPREIEVKMNIAYAKDSNGEYEESPRIKHVKYFHYMVHLNSQGDIIGGYFLRDSSTIDMLWVPLQPKAAGATGNERRGNPYVDVARVLSIWRESVDKELRDKWVTVDPAAQDNVLVSIKPSEPIADDEATSEDEPATSSVNDSVPPVVTDAEEAPVEVSISSDDDVSSTEPDYLLD